MARYTKQQLYERYEKNYAKLQETTLLTRKFTREGFERVYDAMKASGVKTNISRAILNKQNLLSRERLSNLSDVGEKSEKGVSAKELKKKFKDIPFLEEKYGSLEFIPYGGTDSPFKEATNVNRQFTDAQIWFATVIDAGLTKAEAEEAYGY